MPRERLPEALREDDLDASQDLVCSSERIRRELGLRELVALDEGIAATVEWELRNPPEVAPPQLDYGAIDRLFERR